MNSHYYRGTLAKTLMRWHVPSKSRQIATNSDWMMLRLLGWLATTAVVTILIWQIATTGPLWPRAVSGVLLALVGVLAGLRLGADSATAYMTDLQRLNKVLVEQNRDLQDANATLLRQVSAKQHPSSRTA